MADPGPAVADQLEAWLAQRGVAAHVELGARATVGLSQETWFVRVRGEGEGEGTEAVLRLPTAASGGRAIRSQRAALQAVAGRVPAPSLLWYDDAAENPFERPFIVMSRVRGEIPVQWRDLPEPARTRLAEDAIDVLATLHAVDPAPLLGADSKASMPAGELDFYLRRLTRFDQLPVVLRLALWWLERHEPPPAERATLVHGDYRMGNLVVAGERVVGVLDWEMSGAGDPLADVAWCFIPVWGPSGVDEAAMLRRYAERCGAAIDCERLHWQRVLGYVRLAYYALSGTRAFDEGHTDDLRLAALALQLPVHLERLAATLAGERVR